MITKISSEKTSNLLFRISNMLLNLLKKSTAGIAATRPRAVAKSASAIPGATTAKLVFWEIPIAVKLFIIPQTVPNKPINGAVDPTEAKKLRPCLLYTSDAADES